MYEEAWRTRRRALGTDHAETQKSAGKAAWALAQAAVDLAGPRMDSPPGDMERAREFGRRAMETGAVAGRCSIGWVELRSGNYASAFDQLSRLLQRKMFCPPFVFLELSMIELRRNNRDRARDWYLASRVHLGTLQDDNMADFENKVTAMLDLRSPLPTLDSSPELILGALDRLIADYPESHVLLIGRAETLTKQLKFAQAGDDFAKAAAVTQQKVRVSGSIFCSWERSAPCVEAIFRATTMRVGWLLIASRKNPSTTVSTRTKTGTSWPMNSS